MSLHKLMVAEFVYLIKKGNASNLIKYVHNLPFSNPSVNAMTDHKNQNHKIVWGWEVSSGSDFQITYHQSSASYIY